jgi:hypothetical protein
MLECFEDSRLSPEPPEGAELGSQPVISSSFSATLSPVRHARRFVDDPHSTPVDTLDDLISVNVLAGQPIVRGVTEPIRPTTTLTQQAEIGMSIGQHVEIG